MSGKRKGPPLSSEDRRLWRHVAGQIKPLTGRDRLHSRAVELLQDAAAPAAESPAGKPKRRAAATAPQPPAPAALSSRPRPQQDLTHGSRADIDRRKAERLSRGKLPIEATLDLHGLRQAEAHRRLERFLAESQAAGKRCVLIVTGKGLHKEEGGVLRANVPRWLNEAPNRAKVLSFDYAQQKHGGTGALYVLLRRRR
ncbi:Smr/MutS family protein [Pelagibius sp. CAU 1746]|uniref:Smr/MutS family protein n=1 Tax=Pelagibius sp. CAU 1746 TaxID=3140370 RepID=UPI00325A6BF4